MGGRHPYKTEPPTITCANPCPLYHLRHHQISYHKCVHAAIVPLFAPVPERGRSMELHITFQSCQSI